MHIPAFERSPYFLIVLFAIVAGVLSVAILLRKRGLDWREIGLSTMLTVVCLASFSAMSSYLRAGNIHDCGFDGIGAIVGLVFGLGFSLWLFPRQNNQLVEAWSISTPLMYGLSKIACFVVGCCRGISYDGLMAVYYGDSDSGFCPIQLIETIIFVSLFVGLIFASKKLKTWQLMRLSVWASLILKFLLDFLRDTHVKSLLSMNQWILMVFAAGFAVFCYLSKSMKTKNIVK